MENFVWLFMQVEHSDIISNAKLTAAQMFKLLNNCNWYTW